MQRDDQRFTALGAAIDSLRADTAVLTVVSQVLSDTDLPQGAHRLIELQAMARATSRIAASARSVAEAYDAYEVSTATS